MQPPHVASIRPAGADDAPAIAGIYATFVDTTAATFEEKAPDGAEIARRMTARPRLPWFVAEDANRAVSGFAYAAPHHQRSAYRWSVNCSVYLHESSRGSGAASALYRDLIEALRALGYVSLYAGIALPNEASVALHEGIGFRQVALFPVAGFKLGAWREVGWWWLPLRDPPENPPDPAEWTGLG